MLVLKRLSKQLMSASKRLKKYSKNTLLQQLPLVGYLRNQRLSIDFIWFRCWNCQSLYSDGNGRDFLKRISLFQEKVLEATDVIKEKAAEAAKVGSEYAEVLSEKAVNAAEAGNEYLAHGAEVVKEYAT